MRARGCLSAGIVLAIVVGSARADEPVKLRVGWTGVPASLMVATLSAKPELATHLGHSYTVEPIHFAGTSPMIVALAAGDVDIGDLSFSSFGLAIQNAHLTDLRVIADEEQDGVEGYLTNAYLVRQDAPIRTIEDLKGKTLATNAIGAGTDIGMRALLRRHGLEDKRDYTVIEADFAHLVPLLDEGKADAITTIANMINDPAVMARARPIFTMREAMGVSQIIMRVARTGFIEKNRAALVDYFEDDLHELHWYFDPANHAEAVHIVASFNKLPDKIYDSWLFTRKDLYRDPNDRPNLQALADNLKMQKEMGFLAITIDANQYADLGIVDEAARRLTGAK